MQSMHVAVEVAAFLSEYFPLSHGMQMSTEVAPAPLVGEKYVPALHAVQVALDVARVAPE